MRFIGLEVELVVKPQCGHRFRMRFASAHPEGLDSAHPEAQILCPMCSTVQYFSSS